jgi:hypothetical protein
MTLNIYCSELNNAYLKGGIDATNHDKYGETGQRRTDH